jgi:permuted papain-like amidase YaeF/Yiix C92 family enzyme
MLRVVRIEAALIRPLVAFTARFALLACAWVTAAYAAGLRDGDIIFHTSRSAQSAAIQRATHSPYSHVGIVFMRDGMPFVLEAVATVRYTPLTTWIARGSGGHYVIKRLKRALTPAEIAKLRATGGKFVGKPYDLYFEWSDARIYCSELVWKIYQRAIGLELGALAKLRSFDLSDAAVQAKMRKRYGKHVPLDEPVISPGAQFDAPLLETVEQR